MRLRLVLLFVLTMAAHRALGTPGLPSWCTDLQLLAVWLVAPALRFEGRRWLYWAVAIGLVWDLLGQPVVGPGGIAWSAAALSLSALAAVVADRSFRAWAVFGGVAAVIVAVVHALSLLPLDLATTLTATRLLRTALLTGAWCGLVGAVMALDLPSYWRAYRLRRLR